MSTIKEESLRSTLKWPNNGLIGKLLGKISVDADQGESVSSYYLYHLRWQVQDLYLFRSTYVAPFVPGQCQSTTFHSCHLSSKEYHNIFGHFASFQISPSEGNKVILLSTLCFTHHRFNSFPEVLYQIVSLETVLLGNNQVDEVDPHRLIKLVHLSTLDLSNNDLLNIPPELGLCASLRYGALVCPLP